MAKKNTKRGFTLVELIVVLVILAILAALLIPALTGYIDKARKSQVVAETRMLTQAVQTEMSTLYASDEYATQLNADTQTFTAAAKDGNPVTPHEQKLENLADRYNAIVVKSFVPNNYGFTAATSYAEDELVFFSVPYEKNAFTATVNGEPVDVEEVDCGLMAIPVPAGEADIVVTYHTPGLKESITISIAGIIIWILYALVCYNKGKKKGTPELQEAKESTEAVE